MYYRQSIVLFGFVVPFAICAAVVVGGMVLKSKATASYDEKERQFKLAEADRNGAQDVEAQIGKNRQHVERWTEQLEKETANAIASHLKQIGDTLPPKEFQQTAIEYPDGKSGIAAASAQNSSQVKLAFRGTFRSVQQAFLELESALPQLQLQDLKIDPSTSSTSLNFQVTYTAWEK